MPLPLPFLLGYLISRFVKSILAHCIAMGVTAMPCGHLPKCVLYIDHSVHTNVLQNLTITSKHHAVFANPVTISVANSYNWTWYQKNTATVNRYRQFDMTMQRTANVVNHLTMGKATGRLLLIGSRALMPLAATAAIGDGDGCVACPTTAGRGWNDVTVALSFDLSTLDAAHNNYFFLHYNI